MEMDCELSTLIMQQQLFSVIAMVIIGDGNSENVAQVWRKEGFFLNKFQTWGCCRSKQMSYSVQISDFAT